MTTGSMIRMSLMIAALLVAATAHAAVPPATSVTLAISNGSGFATTWNAVPTASYYFLWITDGAGVVRHQTWYRSDEVGCSTGEPTCQKVLTLALRPGTTYMWVQTWNADGYGAWSPEYQVLSHFGLPRVYDSAHTFVGVLFGPETILIEFDGKAMLETIGFTRLGATSSLVYYPYGCDGPPFVTPEFGAIHIVGPSAFIRTGRVIRPQWTWARTANSGGLSQCFFYNIEVPMEEARFVPTSALFGGPLVPPFTVVR
jgi:hypothetical protein